MTLSRTVFELLIAALVVWRVSTSLACAKIFEPFRIWVAGHGTAGRSARFREWLHELVSCQFCLSHYVALVYLAFVRIPLVDTSSKVFSFLVTWMAVVGLSSITARALQKREPAVRAATVALLERYIETRLLDETSASDRIQTVAAPVPNGNNRNDRVPV